MEFIIALAMKFWQWTLVIAFIIIGFLINILDKRKPNKLKFSYTELPHLQALKISTKGIKLLRIGFDIIFTNK